MGTDRNRMQRSADCIRQNLVALAHEQASVTLRKEAQFYEMARLLAAAEPALAHRLGDEAFCADCRLFLENAAPTLPFAAVDEQMAFCRLLFSQSKDTATPEMLLAATPSRAEAKVAYVRNLYADRAYRQISRIFSHCTPHYCEDYRNVCDDIVNGDADYGILPLDNAAEGRLLPFRRLIDQFELKIVCAAEVESSDGKQRILFALLSSALTVLKQDTGISSYLELTVPSSARNRIGALLTAGDLCRLSIVKIDAIPLSYDERGYTTNLLFDTRGSDLTDFLTWMLLFFPVAVPVGLYPLSDPYR